MSPTVADQLLVSSLPEETRDAVRRVYAALMEQAYNCGFEDANDQVGHSIAGSGWPDLAVQMLLKGAA